MSLFTKLVSRMRRSKTEILATGRIEKNTSATCSPCILTFTNDQGQPDHICLGATPGLAEKIERLLAQWRREERHRQPQVSTTNQDENMATESNTYVYSPTPISQESD